MADLLFVAISDTGEKYTNIVYNVSDQAAAEAQILEEARQALGSDNVNILNTIDNIDAADVDQSGSGSLIVVAEINGARDHRGIQKVNESSRANAIATAVNNIKALPGLAYSRVGVKYVIGDEAG